MKYRVALEGRVLEVEIDGASVTVDGQTHTAELRILDGSPVRLLVLDGRTWIFPMEPTGRGKWTVLAGGERRDVEVLDERTAHIRSLVGRPSASAGARDLKAPMPGLVVRVFASPGQRIVEGTSLIVLEAMKMENELKASSSGVVEQVLVAPGRTVEKGELLIVIRGE